MRAQSCPWVELTHELRRVGSVSSWVGLGRVTQNGPTDNSLQAAQSLAAV